MIGGGEDDGDGHDAPSVDDVQRIDERDDDSSCEWRCDASLAASVETQAIRRLV